MAKASSMKAKPEAPQSTSECESKRREESSMMHLRIRWDPSKHSIEFPSMARPETRTTGRWSGAVGTGGCDRGGCGRGAGGAGGWGRGGCGRGGCSRGAGGAGGWGRGGCGRGVSGAGGWVVVAGTKVTGLWRGAGVRCARSVLLVAADTVGLVLGFGVVDGMAIDRRSWVSSSTI